MHKQISIQEGSFSFWIDLSIVNFDDGQFQPLAQINPPGGDIFVVKNTDNAVNVFYVATDIGRVNLTYDGARLDRNKKHQITISWKVGGSLVLFVDGIEVARQAIRDDAFFNDSLEFRNIILNYGAKLTDKIDEFQRVSDRHTAYYAYLKDFLVNSGVLCDDVIQAAANDATLLAMIGARVLIEDAINVHYLASIEGKDQRMAVAEAWFKTSNDDAALKNALDGKSVAQRAKLAGKDVQELYKNEYALFSNYIHSSAHRSILNLPEHRKLGGKKAIYAGLQAYANMVTCVAGLVKQEVPEGIIKTTAPWYFNKHRDSVARATLDIEE